MQNNQENHRSCLRKPHGNERKNQVMDGNIVVVAMIQVTGKRKLYLVSALHLKLHQKKHQNICRHLKAYRKSALLVLGNKQIESVWDYRDFVTMTKKINGGTIGMDDRIARYERIMKIIGA
jgi:predicted chitinase